MISEVVQRGDLRDDTEGWSQRLDRGVISEIGQRGDLRDGTEG